MADVWVSRKKWTCTYCNVTINDDVPSRQHHETGGRHKSNVERALNNLYKKGERERKDAQAAKREMDRIDRLAAASYCKDLAAMAGTGGTSSADAISKTPPIWKPKNKMSAYGSVAPTEKPQVSPAAAETPQAAVLGAAGDWEEVRTASSSTQTLDTTQALSEREQAKAFRMKEKVGRLYDGEQGDSDDHQQEIKVRKRVKVESIANVSSTSKEPTDSISLNQLPAWSALSLADQALAQDPVDTSQTLNVDTKDPPIPSDIPPTKTTAAEHEPAPVTNSLFKKRKAGSGAGAKKVRALV